MGKIKIGQIEGSKEDVVSLFKEEGVDMADYINPSKKVKVPLLLILVGLIVFLIIVCVIVTMNESQSKLRAVLSLIALALAFFNVGLIHMNWKNWGLSVIAAIGELALFSLSHGIYTEKDIVNKEENYIERKI